MSIIYLDNAATTQLNSSVLEQMLPYLKDLYGNPSSNHSLGLKARKAKEAAREKVASLINADSDEIFFTSGATEANNWVAKAVSEHMGNDQIGVISSVEHASVLNSAVGYLHASFMSLLSNPDGCVKSKQLEGFFKYIKHTEPPSFHILFAMMANNETGAVSDIASLAAIAHENGCMIHTDATQALGHIMIDVKKLNVDSLSGSAHKIHGPKGAGFLYVSKKSALHEYIKETKLIYGGHQESGLRAGTENVPGIVGLGAACAETKGFLEAGGEIGLSLLRNTLIERLKKDAGGILNTSNRRKYIPVISMRFPGINNQQLVQLLDEDDVCVSTGSACHEGDMTPSHVLREIGLSDKEISETIRISIGRMNTDEEIDRAAKIICEKVEILRMFSD